MNYRGSIRLAAVVVVLVLAGLVVSVAVGNRVNVASASAPFPTGTVLYVFVRGKQDWIETARLDGTGRRRLTKPVRGSSKQDVRPIWSPDGRTVAFIRSGVGRSRAGIYRVDADGTGLRRIVGDPSTSGLEDLAWSADGRRLVFSRWPVSRAGGCPIERPSDAVLNVVNADGSKPRRLRALPRQTRGPLQAELSSLAWSPDGRRIAYTYNVWGNFDCIRNYPSSSVWVIGSDGSGLRRLAPTGNSIYSLAWSPDGTQIAFAELFDGGVYVVPADGSSSPKLLWQPPQNDEASDVLWAAGGRAVVFTTAHDVYAADLKTRVIRRIYASRQAELNGFYGQSRDRTLVAFSLPFLVARTDGSQRWAIRPVCDCYGAVYLE